MLSRVWIECRGEHKDLMSSLVCSVTRDCGSSVPVWVIKCWAGSVARLKKSENAQRILVAAFLGNRSYQCE